MSQHIITMVAAKGFYAAVSDADEVRSQVLHAMDTDEAGQLVPEGLRPLDVAKPKKFKLQMEACEKVRAALARHRNREDATPGLEEYERLRERGTAGRGAGHEL